MNFLKVLTKQQPDGSFYVFWTNSMRALRGAVRVEVPSGMKDRAIVAELYALQYLLEIVEAVGENMAGNETTKLIVSTGAIKKLVLKTSDKVDLVPYATFLKTRFKGCPIKANKREDWISPVEPSITLNAEKPMPETMTVHGFGEIEITAHVVEQFAERFGKASLGDAWRALMKAASDARVVEIEKDNPTTRLKYALKGREEGRYFYNPANKVMVVVAARGGKESIVTAYPYELV